MHHFFLWTFSIILLIPCEHQESLSAVLVTHMIHRAVSVGEVKSFQDVGLTQKVVEMLKVKQNTTLALNPMLCRCCENYFLLCVVEGNILSQLQYVGI